ncbi:glycosyltransferase family 2 protein [Microvirga sp. 2MCAF38]
MLGDFRSCVLSSFLGRLARPDIHDYLRSDGSLTSVSNEHGFVAIAPVSEEAAAGELFFVEHVPAQNKTTLYGPVATHAIKDEETALNIATQTIGDIQSLSKEAIDRFYRPLLSLPKGDAQARKFHFGPAVAQQPLASIIIPFYGDAFFLNCVHHLQRVLDPTFELVLVVDDPRIWPQIYSGLNSRSSAISVPTTLLQNFRNYGYGRANNLGFLAASSDIIFLMNSDVMVMDGAPLAEAAEAIRSRAAKGEPELVVGFSLLYEDNTIQHVGMEFPRSPLVGGMHLADHPMKGLPFSLYRGERVRRVPAVTAALMGLSSNLFGQLGGFDTIYERGDFEDADLCLRAEQLGAEVELHVHPGLYHLERQSIPNMGHQDLRSMVTYMNCVEFNERWAKRLSEASSPQAPKRVLRIRPRKQIVGSA